ncbi:M23 family metallopeptidase [Phascolarctobacterium succinatutens]|uniref:M23 family metallopeptidase n=2 Tax=Phascolarctobacterium succinatutens TaxID=626940 RepID=UPI003AB65393
MKKIGLLALGLALALGVVAEAGSIPADRVPLQTYAVKKMNCYLQPNGVQKGWIDPGDYVVVTQIRNDGWAYGSYPVGNGRVSRWFRADDLVNNIGFANQERYSPKANTNTYTGSDHSRKFGSFNDNEPILVVSDSGQSRQFIYKVNGGGYKMAWAPYWDCWDARQAGKQQVNNNVINKNPIMKPVQREDKKQEQTSYGVWKATARYTANTYDNPDLRGARAGWITNGSDIEVLGENAKSYFIRYWADNGAKRERYVERTAVKGLNEDKENKKQVNNNVINRNPIVKPVQREDKKQEQASSYGVWKATARYTANTYDNPDLRGMRAGRVTSGSDIEVLGENAKSYFIRYWADNGAKRERYVERTAVKGLNEYKDDNQIGEYVWPIDAYKISCLYYYSGYNDKNKTYNPIKHDATYGRNPSYGFYYWNAMDIEAKNVPVKATADGTVDRVAVFPLSSYGPHIIIRHKDGRYSLYAHLKTGSILVKENQEVKKGQQIANSGYSLSKDKNPKQSWHLHFAITEVGAWQYFRDRVSLCYGNRVIGANKTQASKDNYSKDATEWFNKHNGSYKTY